jgi:PAS domain S-box-containing protein
MELLCAFSGGSGFLPRGPAHPWGPSLIGLHVISDLLIAAVCFTVGFALFTLVRKQENVPFKWLFVYFGLFLAACGLTCLAEVWTLWQSYHWSSSAIKALTALASVPAAILLLRLAPQITHIPARAILENANKELRKAEQRFRAFLESAPDAIVIVNRSGKIVLVNAQTENLFGWKRQELLGQPVELLVPTGLRDGHAGHRDKFFANPKPRVMGADPALFGLRKDGTQFPVEISLSPLETEEGLFVSSAIRDATEREALRRERAARLEAEAAMKAKDRFLAMLSHELRTPLTPVLASIDLLEELSAGAETRYTVSMIRRNVELEAHLIDDMLDLTAITRGKLKLSLQPVDVHSLVHGAFEILHREIEKKRLKTSFRLEAASHFVQADPSRLMQVFWNLIKNAIKFTPGGGTIEVASRNESEKLIVDLADNGAGIEPELLPRIFDSFEQGNRRLQAGAGGLGLGLTISKAIIDAHGAELKASSEGRGRGTTMTLQMRSVAARPVAHSDREQLNGSSKRPAIDPSQPPFHILLVDDHRDTALALRRLLVRQGYDVVVAETLHGALRLAATRDFNLLISDIGLPDGTGFDLLKQIRQRQQINAIALSGFGMEDDVRKSREAGFADHLVKPIDLDRLQAAIREVAVQS